MSSLPWISHRLFVAAVGNDPAEHEKPCGIPAVGVDPGEEVNAISLELLDCTEALPIAGAKPLRASVGLGAGG